MRALAAVLIVLALGLAGCATPAGDIQPGNTEDADPQAPPSSPSSPEPPGEAGSPKDPPPPPENASPPADEPTFCKEEDGCTFWDDDYHQYVLYEVDTLKLDVLIVPSASPGLSGDTAAIKQAIEAWGSGIQQLAAPWFAQSFAMDVYVLGTDSPPQSAIEDPEIVVLAAEYNPALLFGIGYQLPPTPCRGAEAAKAYAPHEHDTLRVLAAECERGGYTCLAINTNNLGGGRYSMYDLVAHEFGHCLGGGHVGDALDFSAKRVPVHDIMSYQSDEDQVHCVSNLNVRVLEAIYAPLAAATVEQPVEAGDYYLMAPGAYRQVTCENPV